MWEVRTKSGSRSPARAREPHVLHGRPQVAFGGGARKARLRGFRRHLRGRRLRPAGLVRPAGTWRGRRQHKGDRSFARQVLVRGQRREGIPERPLNDWLVGWVRWQSPISAPRASTHHPLEALPLFIRQFQGRSPRKLLSSNVNKTGSLGRMYPSVLTAAINPITMCSGG